VGESYKKMERENFKEEEGRKYRKCQLWFNDGLQD
jgi:hypothetical protein